MESLNTPVLMGIAEVSNRTGISHHCLRIWDKRYNNFAADAYSKNGHRLYCEGQIERLTLIQKLISTKNYRIGYLAEMDIERLRELSCSGSFENKVKDIIDSNNDDSLKVFLISELLNSETKQSRK